jgi:hypothetical protein
MSPQSPKPLKCANHPVRLRLKFPMRALAVALLLGWSILDAQAEWAELDKDEDVTHLWDKQAVKAVHVSRYVWTLSDLSKASKTIYGDSYQSEMTRWRLYCVNDTFVKLSVSMFEKPLGKGREVFSSDEQEWKTKEYPIRPNTYLATLKKQVCQNANS